MVMCTEVNLVHAAHALGGLLFVTLSCCSFGSDQFVLFRIETKTLKSHELFLAVKWIEKE